MLDARHLDDSNGIQSRIRVALYFDLFLMNEHVNSGTLGYVFDVLKSKEQVQEVCR